MSVETDPVSDPGAGEKAVRISGAQSGQWSYAVSVGTQPLVAGAKYRLEGWMRLDALSDANRPPFFKAGVSDSSGRGVANFNSSVCDVHLMREWQKLACEFQATDKMAQCYLAVEKGSTDRLGATMALRGVKISKIDAFSPLERPTFNPKPPALDDLEARRPRLYLRASDIGRIRSKLTAYPLSKFWAAVREKADRFVNTSPPARLTGDIRGLGDGLPLAAMAFLLTGEPRYLAGVRKWMDAFCSYPTWPDDRDLGAAHVLTGMAIAYDWLHERFSSDERRRYREKMVHHADILYAAIIKRDIWWARELLQNHNYTNAMAVAVAGVALLGESREAESYLVAAGINFRKVLALLSPDGASQEGIGYWSYGTDALLKYFKAVEPIHGMSGVKESPFFANAARFRLYSSLPGYSDNVDFGDSPRFEWDGPGRILRCLGGIFRDGVAQWLAERIEKARGARADVSWEDLIWYDDSVKPVPPDNLPTNAGFDNLGIVISRTSWADDACWTLFKAGAPQGRQARNMVQASTHAHPDQGQFLLWAYGKWLVIDDGYVYLKRTSNHGVSLFNGIGQRGEGKQWFAFPALVLGEDTAAIVQHREMPSCEYITADLTTIYPPEAGLKKYERTVVLLPKGYLVVRDDVLLGAPGRISRPLRLGTGTLDRTETGFLFTTAGNVSLGIEIFSDGKHEIARSAFAIPEQERWRDSYGNYSGQLLQLSAEGISQSRTIFVLRPAKTPALLPAPKIAEYHGDTLEFDDTLVSFALDFANRTVKTPLPGRSHTNKRPR